MAKTVKATTGTSASASAKRSPLSNVAVRLFGAILAFVGILLVVTKRAVPDMAVTVASTFFIVAGFFLTVSNFKKLIAGGSVANDVIIYFLFGIVLMVAGILLLVFKSSVVQWFIVLLGALISAYALATLIRFIVRPRSKKLMILDIVFAVLAMIAGILIALLYVSEISSAENGVCYYIFGALVIAIGACDLVAY